MTNKSLKSILEMEKYGYSAKFKLRHVSKLMPDYVKLGDIFESHDASNGEMAHSETGEIMNLKGSYIAFEEYIVDLDKMTAYASENSTDEDVMLNLEPYGSTRDEVSQQSAENKKDSEEGTKEDEEEMDSILAEEAAKDDMELTADDYNWKD